MLSHRDSFYKQVLLLLLPAFQFKLADQLEHKHSLATLLGTSLQFNVFQWNKSATNSTFS